jgi:hypothetical protein
MRNAETRIAQAIRIPSQAFQPNRLCDSERKLRVDRVGPCDAFPDEADVEAAES